MSIPKHIAIIMDGNGRWAEARGLARHAGHKEGVRPVRMCIEESARRGVTALTLFAFSSENWQRPTVEVTSLMQLFLDAMDREVDDLHKNKVRLRFIGDRHALSVRLQSRMAASEALTAGNPGLKLQVAVSYGGRWDIAMAARELARRCAAGELQSDEIDEAALGSQVALAGLPDPDLLIRTGGEQRISNFLLWNLAYTELYFLGSPDAPVLRLIQTMFQDAVQVRASDLHIEPGETALRVRQRVDGTLQEQKIDGPLFLGMDTHALSVPALASAIEVLAVNDAEVMIAQDDEYTPTPVISHAVLTYNRGRKTGLADGIVITPSHNPPHDGGGAGGTGRSGSAPGPLL